jgi:NTP pyrophosphatase (non-canonical NTP hydrolase)
MNDIQTSVKRIGTQTEKLGHSKDPNIILLFLMEELGEVARAYLKEEGQKESNDRVTETFREELGDVFYLILRLAWATHTDLEAALDHTVKKLEKTGTNKPAGIK